MARFRIDDSAWEEHIQEQNEEYMMDAKLELNHMRVMHEQLDTLYARKDCIEGLINDLETERKTYLCIESKYELEDQALEECIDSLKDVLSGVTNDISYGEQYFDL